MSESVHNEYLQKYIDPILEKLVIELLMKKPTNDLVDFMVNWLKTKGEEICQNNNKNIDKFNAYGDVSDEEYEEMDDEVEDMLEVQKKKGP